MTPGVVFDAGGLIGLERNDRRVLVLLARANEIGATVTVPASVLAQVVRQLGRQARLARLLGQHSTRVIALDRRDAVVVGRMLAATGTSDVVDAHVVVCAHRSQQAVVTSDPGDLRRFDRGLTLIEI